MRKIFIFFLFLSIVLFLTSVLIVEKNNPKAADSAFSGIKFSRIDEKGKKFLTADRDTAKKECDLEAYGMDCAITAYLEKNLGWLSKNGANFCSYEEFGASGAGQDRFLYAVCQEFYLFNGKIYMGSGVTIPLKLMVSGGIYSHWVPRDGSFFTSDVETMFPREFQKDAINYGNFDVLQKINIFRAERNFNASIDYSIIEILDQACVQSIDCATPERYLMLSSCQYASRCVNGRCAVICPEYYRIEN